MTTWTNQQPLSGQTPISYNQSGVQYNQILYTYSGKLKASWSNQTKN